MSKPIDLPELLKKLEAMSGSTTAQEAREWIARVNRLLLPVILGLSELAWQGESYEDEAPIFTFKNETASASTTLGEFRALFGDERKLAAELKKLLNI